MGKGGEMIDELINRLENWKFKDAKKIADRVPLTSSQHEIINCLAISYGNCGWFGGAAGDLVASIVRFVCAQLEEK